MAAELGSEGLLKLIAGDLRAKAQWVYGAADRAAALKAFCADGTFATIVYRLMQWSRRRRLEPLAMLFNKLNAACAHCLIGRGADFGPELVLIHSHGTVINGAVRGGRGVKLEHDVTLGAERGLSPVLGNDVFVGCGARVLGAVTVGDGAKIGANAVVLKDVPAGATAIGVPARLILRGAPDAPEAG